jgi:outer membrane protein assembly factor BamB
VRQRPNQAIIIFLLFATFILSSCGGNGQQGSNTAMATTVGTSEVVLVETSGMLSATRANDGTSLWTVTSNGNNISQPLAITANRVYYSTSSNIAAVNLTTGKQLWSEPVSNSASDLQASSTLVYVLNGSLLSAFDATTGALKWHTDNVGLQDTGEGQSGNKSAFIISGNTIYTAISGILTALDATTGSQLWQFTPPNQNAQGTGSISVEGIALSNDGKLLIVSTIDDAGSGTQGDALYAVNTDSHQEAWHLDPTSTTTDIISGNVSTFHDMTLSWFILTADNHILLFASFITKGQNGDSPPMQDGYHYLTLSSGSEVWSLPFTGQNQPGNEGNGQALVVGDDAFYSISGPSNGDVSATSLNNHQQEWNTPSSGSYNELYLSNNILLAGSNVSGNALTAFNVLNGKQLWQQQIPRVESIFIVGQRVFVEQVGQTEQGSSIMAIDQHSGHKLWSTPDNSIKANSLQNIVEVKS